MVKIGQKLTPTVKKKIKKDWHACFPELTIEDKSFGLSRMIWPLLITLGFGTKTFDNEYYPNFGVHNLCRSLDFLSSILDEPLRKRGVPDSVSFNRHEKGVYLEMAERMRQQVILPFEDPISLSMMIQAYQKYTDKQIQTIDQLEDPALIAAWAGQSDRAEQALEWGYRQLVDRQIFKRSVAENGGTPEGWREQMRERISRPEELRQICHQQIIEHNLGYIPQEPLLLD